MIFFSPLYMFSLIKLEKENLVIEQSTNNQQNVLTNFVSMCIINFECTIIKNSYEFKTIFPYRNNINYCTLH